LSADPIGGELAGDATADGGGNGGREASVASSGDAHLVYVL
jgi:hypothetical protein